MRVTIEDIIDGVVDSIDKTCVVSKIVDADQVLTTLYLCDLKWIKIGSIVSDELGNEVIVSEVGSNYIVVDKAQYIIDNNGASFVWTSKKLTIIKDIYYVKGTALAVNGEWTKLTRDEREKTPFVWLVKPTTETTNLNGQGIVRSAELRIYFLDATDVKNYTESEHNEKVLTPLWQWVLGFFDAIKKNKDFANIDSYTSRELNRFGTESPQGFESNILDSNLSAIELRFTLSIRNGAKCLCMPNKALVDGLVWTGEEYVDLGENNLLGYE
jgi:hypothetical protein